MASRQVNSMITTPKGRAPSCTPQLFESTPLRFFSDQKRKRQKAYSFSQSGGYQDE